MQPLIFDDNGIYLWLRDSPICSRCYRNAQASSTLPSLPTLILPSRFPCDCWLASLADESLIGARKHCHPIIITSALHNRIFTCRKLATGLPSVVTSQLIQHVKTYRLSRLHRNFRVSIESELKIRLFYHSPIVIK